MKDRLCRCCMVLLALLLTFSLTGCTPFVYLMSAVIAEEEQTDADTTVAQGSYADGYALGYEDGYADGLASAGSAGGEGDTGDDATAPGSYEGLIDDEYADSWYTTDYEVDRDDMNVLLGSAQELQGDVMLLTIYVQKANKPFSQKNIDRSIDYLGIGLDFIEQSATEYGKSVNFLYGEEDLCYTYEYKGSLQDFDTDPGNTLDKLYGWIESEIDLDTLIAKYNTNNYAFVCVINDDGQTQAYPYYIGDAPCGLYEVAAVYLRFFGEYGTPSGYAHELLHLFGAPDWYIENEADGVTSRVVSYMEQNHPMEVMLTTYDENERSIYNRVPNELSDLTAYRVGWIDTCAELELFPELEMEVQGSFVYEDAA